MVMVDVLWVRLGADRTRATVIADELVELDSTDAIATLQVIVTGSAV